SQLVGDVAEDRLVRVVIAGLAVGRSIALNRGRGELEVAGRRSPAFDHLVQLQLSQGVLREACHGLPRPELAEIPPTVADLLDVDLAAAPALQLLDAAALEDLGPLALLAVVAPAVQRRLE